MASLDWQVRTPEDITLVEAQVTSSYETQVRLESSLTPVWAPRTQGVPAEGWDETGYKTTVTAGETVAIGYASPADPVEPPVELVADEPVATMTTAQAETQPSARELIRTLGDARPPRDIISREKKGTAHTQPSHAATDQQDSTMTANERPETHSVAQPISTTHHSDYRDTQQLSDSQPAQLQSWFDAVEQRIESAEQLADPTDAAQARRAITENGGMKHVRQLAAQLAADRKQLTALGKRHQELSERLATTEIPVQTLERLE